MVVRANQRSSSRQGDTVVIQVSSDILVLLCRANGIPDPEPEYPFALPRKWRFGANP
jgi:hypothetical protein